MKSRIVNAVLCSSALTIISFATASASLYPAPEVSGLTVDTPADAATIRANIGDTPLLGIENMFPEPTSTGTGLQFRYLLPNADTLLIDYSTGAAGSTVSLGSSTATIRNGQITFNFGGPITLPSFGVALQTINLVFDNAVEAATLGSLPSNTNPSLLGYSTGPGINVRLTQGYGGNTNSQGYGVRWLGYTQNSSGINAGTLGNLDNGVHYVTLLSPTGGTIALYLDGKLLAPAINPPGQGAMPTAATVWQFGGSTLTCQTTASNCYFGGNLLYADGSATLYTSVQVQQEYQAEQNWMARKGITFPAAIENANVNIGEVLEAESVGDGHNLASPGVNNFTAYSMGYLSAALNVPTTMAGTITAGSNILAVTTQPPVGAVQIGYAVTGAGIPAGTTISGVNGTNVGTSYTMSANATASATAEAMTLTSNITTEAIPTGEDNEAGPQMDADAATIVNSVGGNWGIRFLGLHTHGNTLSVADGTYNSSNTTFWTNTDTSAYSQTAQDIKNFMAAVKKANAGTNGPEWYPLVYTTISGPNSFNASLHRDTANLLIEEDASLYHYTAVDFDDIRVGADAAAANDTTRNCTLDTGGSIVDSNAVGGLDYTYQQVDHNHGTVCGDELLAHMNLAALTWLINATATPEFSAATTYVSGPNDFNRTLILNGSAATTVTLNPPEGLAPGTAAQIVKNDTAYTATVNAAASYNGGAATQIDGGTSVTVPAGGSATFYAVDYGPVLGGAEYTVH